MIAARAAGGGRECASRLGNADCGGCLFPTPLVGPTVLVRIPLSNLMTRYKPRLLEIGSIA